MKKLALIIILLILVIAAGWAASFKWKNFRGVGPALLEPPEDITKVINTTSLPAQTGMPASPAGGPLKLPPRFSIEIFAKDLPGARVMRLDSFGNMWVSRTSKGAVSLLEIGKESGAVRHQEDVFKNLRNPHGLAFDPDFPFALYIAEEHQIRRIGTYSEDPGQTILELPSGGGHFTRTLGFGPDKKLYISVGSSCNVCREANPWRATILRHDLQEGKTEVFAKGLRNAVFFAWHPVTKKLWATEMGRDLLGDNLPPDEINIVEDPSTNSEQAGNFGWPTCYGKNIHDTAFDKKTYIRNPCMEPFEKDSYINIPAHSAPLGLAFFPQEARLPDGQGWPKEFHDDLLVAYHGSWNRDEPTGYKIVRIRLDSQGNYESTDSAGSPQVEDFITGWLTPEGALGRPVDILIQ